MFYINHIIVCYGGRLDYYHGAKYQILRLVSKFFDPSRNTITVLTDRPDLFEHYPVNILELTNSQKLQWSLNGLQHFGIKLKGFEYAMMNVDSEISIISDTDMYWIKNPILAANKVKESGAIMMYQNEGTIYGTRNRSIQRFEEGLKGKVFHVNEESYRLSRTSEMWASNIIALPTQKSYLINDAYHLFSQLEPFVDAHTVEQFAVSETLRLRGIPKISGKRLLGSWSSTGRKLHVAAQLKEFFTEHGENEFDDHFSNWKSIKIKRPFATLIDQKFKKTCDRLAKKLF